MKKYILLVLLVLFSNQVSLKSVVPVLNSSSHQPELQSEDTLTLTFIANSGFILSWSNHRIAMDALWEGYHTGMHVEPGAEAITMMKTCRDLYSNLDLITVSHEHLDHVSTDILGEHLLCNTEALVLCDSIVANAFEEFAQYSLVKGRVLQSNPPENSSSSDTIHDITIKIFQFHHGRSNFYNIMNLAFLLDLNGTKIFHAGDAQGEYPEELESLNLEEENIDIAFLHVDFMYASVDGRVSDGLEKVLQYIDPKNIVLVHNKPSYLDGGYVVVDSVKNRFPNIYIFDNEGEERKFINGAFVNDSIQESISPRMENISVFPNPVQDYLFVEAGIPNPSPVHYEILSMDGKMLQEGIFKGSCIDVTSLNPGIYLLRYTFLDQTGTKMVIKN